MSTYKHEPTSSSGAGKYVFLLLLVVVAGVGYLGYTLFGRPKDNQTNPTSINSSTDGGTNAGGPGGGSRQAASGGAVSTSVTGAGTTPTKQAVEINIAYGTEKENWLKWAAEQFANSPRGEGIQVNLIGMGSVEGARAVVNGPGETPIHVWSPASRAYRDKFEADWELQHPGSPNPIGRSEDLALTPMVFVMWKQRYELFKNDYQTTFKSLAEAMHAEGGWGTIGNKPDWGLFKFGHTHPNKSNSGMLTLVLIAYDFHEKQQDLTVADVTNAEFQTWLKRFERGVARPSGSLTHSTGTLMREMVLRGPGSYDCIMVYENLAIDYLKAAQGRWGELHIAYPARNIWNDHPYFVLNVPWSSKEQQTAAGVFLDFLMTEPIQRQALEHGFRPGDPKVPIRFPQSPFVKYSSYGLQIDVSRVVAPPKAAVLTELQASFERIDR